MKKARQARNEDFFYYFYTAIFHSIPLSLLLLTAAANEHMYTFFNSAFIYEDINVGKEWRRGEKNNGVSRL